MSGLITRSGTRRAAEFPLSRAEKDSSPQFAISWALLDSPGLPGQPAQLAHPLSSIQGLRPWRITPARPRPRLRGSLHPALPSLRWTFTGAATWSFKRQWQGGHRSALLRCARTWHTVQRPAWPTVFAWSSEDERLRGYFASKWVYGAFMRHTRLRGAL